MARYIRIYQTLLHLNISALTAYRANFTTNVTSSITWALFSIFSIVLLTARTSEVFGWRREEILFLTAAYSILIGIFHMVFSKNFERFSRLVYYGQLDGILLKPVDSQFLVSFWLVNYASLFRIIFGVGFAAYLIHQYHIPVSPVSVVGFIVLVGVGLLLLYSVWFLVASLTIWYPRLSNIVQFMYSVSGMMRYPQEMYRQFAWYIFLFLLPI